MTTSFIEIDISESTEMFQWLSSLQRYAYYQNWPDISKAMDEWNQQTKCHFDVTHGAMTSTLRVMYAVPGMIF